MSNAWISVKPKHDRYRSRNCKTSFAPHTKRSLSLKPLNPTKKSPKHSLSSHLHQRSVTSESKCIASESKCIVSQSEPKGLLSESLSDVRITQVSPDMQLIETLTISYPQENPQYNKWNGIDYGDGKYRLYRYVSPRFRGKRRNHYVGRLITSFTKDKLLHIAWKIGVSNPDGFSQNDCVFLGLNHDEGFEHFKSGWDKTNKIVISNYIWNRLYDNGQVFTL